MCCQFHAHMEFLLYFMILAINFWLTSKLIGCFHCINTKRITLSCRSNLFVVGRLCGILKRGPLIQGYDRRQQWLTVDKKVTWTWLPSCPGDGRKKRPPLRTSAPGQSPPGHTPCGQTTPLRREAFVETWSSGGTNTTSGQTMLDVSQRKLAVTSAIPFCRYNHPIRRHLNAVWLDTTCWDNYITLENYIRKLFIVTVTSMISVATYTHWTITTWHFIFDYNFG